MNFKRADKRFFKSKAVAGIIITVAIQIVLMAVFFQIYRMRKFAFIGYIVWSLITVANIYIFTVRNIFLLKNFCYYLGDDFLIIKGGFEQKYEIYLPYERITGVERRPILKKKAAGLSRVVFSAEDEKFCLICADEGTMNFIFGKINAGVRVDGKENKAEQLL